MNWNQLDMTFAGLRGHYRVGDFTPRQLLAQLQSRAHRYRHKNIWICRLSSEQLDAYLQRLETADPAGLPLYGIPFAIKDNIDLVGVPTTAACPAFSYTPQDNAVVVQGLIDAGAVPLGKTNMDQFATGLAGTRSPPPWGPCSNAFDDDYIAGGSSSGSALAVALGLASFALGTDTAGSGRVPAALNNIYGLKPTRGLLSSRGVVPACRSLDSVSIFALTASDAGAVFDCAAVYDPADGYARRNHFANSRRVKGVAGGPLRIGVPRQEQLEFYGDEPCSRLFQQNVRRWEELGAQRVELDFSPFAEAAALLYQGPWVSERTIAPESLLAREPEQLHAVVRQIIAPGTGIAAVDAFKAQYRLSALKVAADTQLARVDMLLTPTIPVQLRIEDVLADPIARNSQLGYYTNFMNLLDYAAIAVPGGFTERGIPAGFTLLAPAWQDQKLLAWARFWQSRMALPLGALEQGAPSEELPPFSDPAWVELVVCGAHLEGLALNWQLLERGGQLQEKTRSAPNYRLYALADGLRPGLRREGASSGAGIEVEVWRLPAEEFGHFVAAIPAPLGIGKVELCDGRWLSGFICDDYGLEGAEDITCRGSWRAHLAALSRLSR